MDFEFWILDFEFWKFALYPILHVSISIHSLCTPPPQTPSAGGLLDGTVLGTTDLDVSNATVTVSGGSVTLQLPFPQGG